MTKERGSKGARSFTAWHKHKRAVGKRMIAKSNRKGAKLALKEEG